MDGNTALGASSPAKPALIVSDPLSMITGVTAITAFVGQRHEPIAICLRRCLIEVNVVTC